MNGPLRIRRAPARAAAAGEAPGPIDPWILRLVKLVPAEVVGMPFDTISVPPGPV